MYQNMFNNGGMQYQQAQQYVPKKWTNPLTPEQEALLRKTSEAFTLAATPEEMARAICTHKDVQKGQITLVQNPDGTVTCTKCGTTFNLVDNVSQEDIDKTLVATVDILETIKTINLDTPDEVIQSVYPMITILNKAGKMYQGAVNNWKNYGVQANLQQTPGYGNPYSILNNAIGGGMMGMAPGYTAPTTGYQNGWTGYPQQQMQTPYMTAPYTGNPWMAPPSEAASTATAVPPNPNPAPGTTTTSTDDSKVTVNGNFEI